MQRLTFYDIRNSRIPQVLGECNSNTPALLSYVNEAQQRLILAGGESGWWGGWARIVFTVIPCASPYVTTPREVSRITDMDVCHTPIRIQNEFYEFLEFGIGLQHSGGAPCGVMQAFDRGQYPTMRDLTPGNKLRIYASNANDVAQQKRIFVQGKDSNNNPIYTMDNGVQVTGFFMTLKSPFVDSAYNLNTIERIQKDVMLGPISLFEVDASSNETLLSTFAPGETNPAYRRYMIKGAPSQCCSCNAVPGQVQVTAMCKLDYVPATCDTDSLVIGNLPALKCEMLAIRYGEMDKAEARQLAINSHKEAIRLLNMELIAYLGKQQPALIYRPFGDPRRQVRLQMI